MEPPEDELPIPHFRTVRDQALERPSPNLLETVYEMLRRQEWMREYLLDEGASPLAFVGSHRVTDDAAAVAKDMRQTMGVGTAWASSHHTWTSALSGLVALAESIGIMVVTNGVVGNDTHRKLDPEVVGRIDALSASRVWVPFGNQPIRDGFALSPAFAPQGG